MKLPIPMEELVRIAREAGALGIRYFGRVRAERKPDGTLVTEADRAVQRLIVEALRARVPDATELYVLAEEDTAPPNPGLSDPAAAKFVAAVDPVDGTTSFAAGLPLWGISMGLLAEGRPVAGVVHMPLLGGPQGWTFSVDVAGPARLNGDPVTVREHRPFDSLTQLNVPSGFSRWARLVGFRGKLRSLGSTAHHLSLVAAGRVDAAVLGRPHLWDIAAGAALLERAGGVICTTGGDAVDWLALYADDRPTSPLVSGAPDTVDDLLARLELQPRPARVARVKED